LPAGFAIIAGVVQLFTDYRENESFMNERDIDCRKCRHYYITWDKKFPYGCRAIQFKSAKSPSFEVYAASGQACLRFHDKTMGAKGDKT